MSDNRQRLYLGEVDIVEAQYCEHLRQRTFIVRQREHKACLIGFLHRAKQVGLVRIADYEEAGEIVLIVLDMVFQHL